MKAEEIKVLFKKFEEAALKVFANLWHSSIQCPLLLERLLQIS